MQQDIRAAVNIWCVGLCVLVEKTDAIAQAQTRDQTSRRRFSIVAIQGNVILS